MAKDMQKIFAGLVEDMAGLEAGDDFLQTCMSLDQEKIRLVPLRYRILAMGFAQGMTLDQVNSMLLSHGCAALYSRSFWEATLIFAFLHRLSYAQWAEIRTSCQDLYSLSPDDAWFSERKITFGDLEDYVRANSVPSSGVLVTDAYTSVLLHALSRTGDSVQDLRTFFTENIRAFSPVREKTRYYFCKYLHAYLTARVERYFSACRAGHGVEEALDDLLCLKVVTVLRRNLTMPEEKKRELIRSSAVSCGEIFSAFSYFFFDFVSLDWVEELMDCYGRPEDIPERHKKVLADMFRRGHRGWKKLTDDEVIRKTVQLQEKNLDSAGKPRSRSGELAVYGYIQGRKDIDRLTLMCFLLFFASNAEVPPDLELTPERMNTILLRCGYSVMDPEDDADWFVTEFLESDEKIGFMRDILTGYAQHHENSFLYRLYGNSVQYADELARVMLSSARTGDA